VGKTRINHHMFDGLYMFRPPIKMVILGMVYYLAGGFKHFLVSIIYGIILPID
jgi:hypothetical protein